MKPKTKKPKANVPKGNESVSSVIITEQNIFLNAFHEKQVAHYLRNLRSDALPACDCERSKLRRLVKKAEKSKGKLLPERVEESPWMAYYDLLRLANKGQAFPIPRLPNLMLCLYVEAKRLGRSIAFNNLTKGGKRACFVVVIK